MGSPAEERRQGRTVDHTDGYAVYLYASAFVGAEHVQPARHLAWRQSGSCLEDLSELNLHQNVQILGRVWYRRHRKQVPDCIWSRMGRQ